MEQLITPEEAWELRESDLIDVNTAIECMNAMKIGNQIALISQNAINNLTFISSYELSETRRLELDKTNRQARQETNMIVEQVMKKRVQKINEAPAEMPIVNRKKGE